MSNNITRITSPSLQGGQAPLPGRGEDAKKEAVKFKPVTDHTVVKRPLPALDLAPAEADADEPSADEPAASATPAEKDRHARWKEDQEKKRAARALAKDQAEAKRQMRAADLLRKGDLPGAAAAVGLPVSEFVALTNQGALGIKPEAEKPKELSPQEKLDADRAAFSSEMKAWREEQAIFARNRDITAFIQKNIEPVLADKDAYEVIHAKGAADVATFAYKYMDDHYRETTVKDADGKVIKEGEILSAKDVLDGIEAGLLAELEKTVERQKPIKKLAKYYATAAPGDGGEPAEEVAEVEAGSTSLSAARRKLIMAAVEAEQADAEPESAPVARAELGAKPTEVETPPADPARPRILRGSTGNVRAPRLLGGRMTAAEKLALVRAEDEAAAREASNAAKTLAARRR